MAVDHMRSSYWVIESIQGDVEMARRGLFDDDPDEEAIQPQETRAHVFVSGRVQGVCFRLYTRRQAQQIGVTGWVRNRWDGRVEAIFEGSEHAVKRAVAWCHEGSPDAHVARVDVEYEPATGEFRTFNIR